MSELFVGNYSFTVLIPFRASLGTRLETEGVEPLSSFHSSSLGNKEIRVNLKKVGRLTRSHHNQVN